MRNLFAAATAIALGFMPAQSAQADVVVELFTSQGCSSCPPADELLAELTKRDGVIALSLHVDYWDYLGWKDEFANPAFTQRQRGYAAQAGSSMIYTPQMIVGGKDSVVGTRGMELADYINKHAAMAAPVKLVAKRDGRSVTVRAEVAGSAPQRMVVQLVEYSPSETVAIKRGELAGHNLTYHNVVRSWTKVADWNGAVPLSFEATTTSDAPAVILVQDGPTGPILAAERVN
ncbi:MAG: DUF1223 domain-containing protein [Pseudomonadota bacterium]